MLSLTQRIMALSDCAPFHRLKDSEIAIISEATFTKTYEKDDVVVPSGKSMHSLLVTIDGSLSYQGKTLPKIFLLKSLWQDTPIRDNIVAKSNVVLLGIPRSKFFTIAYECPDLMMGFCEMSEAME